TKVSAKVQDRDSSGSRSGGHRHPVVRGFVGASTRHGLHKNQLSLRFFEFEPDFGGSFRSFSNHEVISMEGLTPSLRLVLVLRETLERGDSVRNAVRDFVHNYPSPFAQRVSLWMVERDNGKAARTEFEMLPSERFLVRVIDRGLRGEAIITTLKELEGE